MLVVLDGPAGQHGRSDVAAVAAGLSPAVRQHFAVVTVDLVGSGEADPIDCLSRYDLGTLTSLGADPTEPAAAEALADVTRSITFECTDVGGPGPAAGEQHRGGRRPGPPPGRAGHRPARPCWVAATAPPWPRCTPTGTRAGCSRRCWTRRPTRWTRRTSGPRRSPWPRRRRWTASPPPARRSPAAARSATTRGPPSSGRSSSSTRSTSPGNGRRHRRHGAAGPAAAAGRPDRLARAGDGAGGGRQRRHRPADDLLSGLPRARTDRRARVDTRR